MDESWQTVFCASGMTQARIIAGRLEAEGIATHLQYDAATTIYAITIDGIGEVRILVPPDDAARAMEILGHTWEDESPEESGCSET
ncbi:MAG: hypothetical protein A4E73_00418 [Syntrophaceae bacterium PtaU1.Bin231]|nr:MAG: hypothetical protein A4E73_00418 [Syntrophaceae bacterium PtaU1.Bin231]HOG18433.1 DUF2007 domain-containing protein [Syntrophales bacterium]